ncbi:MAG: DUF4974 domain-containing protein [Bacteroidales bacterium]|nr:DUF4974 domain-containing protein [Bacteroidales bacterium]MBS3775836.1 DUF4974 domain-containing protein [Bacteroidales bacterium]
MKEELKYKELIVRYLNGKASPQEKGELLQWLKESPKHMDFFARVKKDWDPFLNAEDFVDDAYQEFQSKKYLRRNLNEAFERRSGVKKRFIYPVLKVAAVLLIGLFVGFWIYEYDSTAPEKQTAQTVITSPRGQKSRLILPDSTSVWLNSESTIRYASDFLNNREVRLEGEAFFNVRKSRKSVFSVQTDDYRINVKGTEFNVMAYEDFDRTETTVVNGNIEVSRKGQSVGVKAKEKVVYEDGKLEKEQANVLAATSWKDDIFYFDQVPFKELVKRLERWYDVNITLKGEDLSDIEYSGVFRNEETVWQVLDVVQMTTPIEYKRNQFREIVITNKSN